MNSCTIHLYVKDPDEFGRAVQALGLERPNNYFEYGEYASFELTINEDMTVTGRIPPVKFNG